MKSWVSEPPPSGARARLVRLLAATGPCRAPQGALAAAGAVCVCVSADAPPAAYALADANASGEALCRFVGAAAAAECLPWLVWLQLDAQPWAPLLDVFDVADATGAGLAISWGGPLLALRRPGPR